jgi:hypothetical protein
MAMTIARVATVDIASFRRRLRAIALRRDRRMRVRRASRRRRVVALRASCRKNARRYRRSPSADEWFARARAQNAVGAQPCRLYGASIAM